MQVTLHLDGRVASGGSPLIMHNERLADPLDDYTRAIAEYSSKRKKTVDDHQEMARLEFLGGLYTEPPLSYPLNGSAPVVALPAWNILRCLQDGGRRHKRGVDVPRGIYPLAETVPIQFEGPEEPEELWKDGGFHLRKSVGVQRSRTMRTRPLFSDWQAELPIEVDAKVFDLHTLKVIWKDAGTYAGLGDMRPVYGRFAGVIA
jgi:hypothetical protein